MLIALKSFLKKLKLKNQIILNHMRWCFFILLEFDIHNELVTKQHTNTWQWVNNDTFYYYFLVELFLLSYKIQTFLDIALFLWMVSAQGLQTSFFSVVQYEWTTSLCIILIVLPFMMTLIETGCIIGLSEPIVRERM